MKQNHIAYWKDIQDDGCQTEQQLVDLIRASLLTPEQNKYLIEHKFTIEDLLNGRYPINIENEIHAVFYKLWNDELARNGLKRDFSEDPIGAAMLESIEKTLGMPIKFIP